ncbi:MAG: RQC domain-containing protein [Bacteroidia bacterium]
MDTAASIINIQAEATAILKTVLLLNEKFSMKYVCEILRGTSYFLKAEEHKQLETYCLLQRINEEKLLNMIDYLVEDAHLKVKDNAGILAVTEKGKRFLAQEHELWIDISLLQNSPIDTVLTEKFKRLRKEWAEANAKRPYEIFTDYSLRKIVQLKPTDFLALKEAHLLGQTTLFGYGMQIIEIVKGAIENLVEVREEELKKRVLLPKYQAIKAAFNLENDLNTIKNTVNQSLYSTVLCLTELHETGYINLCPWIEKHVAKETLTKGTNFFQHHVGVSLKDAHWNTGIEYEILRFCKVYQAAA